MQHEFITKAPQPEALQPLIEEAAGIAAAKMAESSSSDSASSHIDDATMESGTMVDGGTDTPTLVPADADAFATAKDAADASLQSDASMKSTLLSRCPHGC